MNVSIGYVFVSQVHSTYWHPCGAPGCGPRYFDGTCRPPQRPGCHAACVRDPARLAEHPECQEWQRQYDAWVAAHYSEKPTGGTRLGPLHYFSDCLTLTKRGPRRADGRIVELDAETAKALGLPLCKECACKMAPFERQMDQEVVK